MFNYKNEYSNEEIGTGTQKILNSGCYEATVEKTGILKSNDSQSETLIFHFKTEDNQSAKVLFCYKDKNGNDVDFNNKHLSHFVDILHINPASIKEVKNEEGKLHYPSFENLKIGVFLTFKGMRTYTGSDGNEYEDAEYNFRGFYDHITQRTAKEIRDNSAKAQMYETWKNNFETENRIRDKKENEKSKYKENKSNFDKAINNAAEEAIDDDYFPF